MSFSIQRPKVQSKLSSFLPSKKRLSREEEEGLLPPLKKVVMWKGKNIEEKDLPTDSTDKLLYLRNLVRNKVSFPLSWVTPTWKDLEVQKLIAHCAKSSLTANDVFYLKKHFSKHLNDRDLAISLLQLNFKLYKYLDPQLRIDGYLIEHVVKADPRIFELIMSLSKNKNKSLNDPIFLEGLIVENKEVFGYLPKDKRGIVFLALKAISQDVAHIQKVSFEQEKNKKFTDEFFNRMHTTILEQLIASEHVSEEIRNVAVHELNFRLDQDQNQ